MLGTATLMAGSALAGMATSSMNAGIQYGSSKALAKYNYELGQRSLRASPKNYKLGLIEAGINPILASNTPIGATQGSSGVNPNFDAVGDAAKGVSAKMLADQTKSQVELNKTASVKNASESQATLKNAESNMMQAQAALKNAETNEKMLTVSGVNAGANVTGAVGNLARDGAIVYGTAKGVKPPTTGASAKGLKGAVSVPAPTSAGSTSKFGKVLSGVGTVLAPGLTNYGTAAGLAVPAAYYGIGKYMEGKGYGKIVDEGPNKNELKHRTGGLGNSSTKTKTSKRRHN